MRRALTCRFRFTPSHATLVSALLLAASGCTDRSSSEEPDTEAASAILSTPNLFQNPHFDDGKLVGYTSEYTKNWTPSGGAAPERRSHDVNTDIHDRLPALPSQYGYGGGGKYLMAANTVFACNYGGGEARPCRIWCNVVSGLTPGLTYRLGLRGTALSPEPAGKDEHLDLLVLDSVGSPSAGTTIGTVDIVHDAADPDDWSELAVDHIPSQTSEQYCVAPRTYADNHYIGLDQLEMRSYCGNGACEHQYGENGLTCPADCSVQVRLTPATYSGCGILSVAAETNDPDAVIHYTAQQVVGPMGCPEPTTADPIYTGPIQVNLQTNMTQRCIKARAFISGVPVGNLASGLYSAVCGNNDDG